MSTLQSFRGQRICLVGSTSGIARATARGAEDAAADSPKGA